MLFALVTAMRSILTAFDGWYAPIYMAEENTDPVRTLPRAIIGGAALVAVLYLMINLAMLHVLPLSVLAASQLPAADAARVVSDGGTPRTSLALTSVVVAVLILTGTFEQIVALFAVLFLVYYVSAFLAVFVLRYREPDLQRPYRAFGYPLTTAVVLVSSVAFLVAAIADDPRSGVIAAVFLAACAPAYSWSARRR